VAPPLARPTPVFPWPSPVTRSPPRPAGNEVEPYWPILFSKFLKDRIEGLILSGGAGGGGGGGSAAAAPAAATEAPKEEKKKEEKKEEEDVDLGAGLSMFGGGDGY
jgi:large subunit ribosomal protein LP1